MALIDLIPNLLETLKFEEPSIEHNKRLYDIYNGQLGKYAEETIKQDVKDANARREMVARMSPINILPTVVKKKAKVYNRVPLRNYGEENSELLSFYEDALNLNTQLQYANELLELQKRVLLELFVHEGAPKLRVIPAQRFLVYSNDQIDPTNPQVIIKFMGTRKEYRRTDLEGDALDQASQHLEDVQTFHAWSADEFIVFDSNGSLRPDIMKEMGLEDTDNPSGLAQFLYLNQSMDSLLPLPDADTFRMATLLPVLLSDLNFATKYMSHSRVFAIGVDPSTVVPGGPDKITFLNAQQTEDGEVDQTPSLNTINPSVDSEKALELIKAQFSMWLETQGLKPGSVGTMKSDQAISGIAKMIDEASVTDSVDKSKNFFSNIEDKLWSSIKELHNEHWNIVPARFRDAGFHVTYADSKPVIDLDQVLERQLKMLDAGLQTRKNALLALNPDLDEAGALELLMEIEQENQADRDGLVDALQEGEE